MQKSIKADNNKNKRPVKKLCDIWVNRCRKTSIQILTKRPGPHGIEYTNSLTNGPGYGVELRRNSVC